MMLSGFLLTLPLLGGPILPAGEVTDSVFRSYDLGAHSGRGTRYQGDDFLFPGSVVRAERPDYERHVWCFEPSTVVDILHSLLEDELEYEGRHYGISENDEFSLYAPESVHKQVNAILNAISEASRSRAQLQVDVFHVPPGQSSLPAGILSVKDADKALELFADQLVESYRIPLQVNLESSLEVAKRQECLLDYDVEVAGNSVAHDPVMVTLVTGTRLQVKATPSANGCDLAMLYWSGEPASAVRTRSYNSRGTTHRESGGSHQSGPDVIQSVSTKQRSLALNTSIPRDSALAFSLDMNVFGGEGQQRVLVRLVGDLQPTVQTTQLDSGQKLHLIREDFQRPPIANWQGDVFGLPGSVGQIQDKLQEFGMDFQASIGNSESEFGMELLQNALENFDLNFTDNWLICTEREIDGPGAEPIVRNLMEQLSNPSELVQVSLKLTRPGQKGALLTYDLPLRVGTESAVVMGVESSIIRDFDVMIASGSNIADPIGCIDLDGAICLLRPTRTADGRTQLRVQLSAQIVDKLQETSAQDHSFGRIDQALYSQLMLDQTVEFEGNGPHTFSLGNSSKAGGGLGLEVIVSKAAMQSFNFKMSIR